jgi:hypothetical protein
VTGAALAEFLPAGRRSLVTAVRLSSARAPEAVAGDGGPVVVGSRREAVAGDGGPVVVGSRREAVAGDGGPVGVGSRPEAVAVSRLLGRVGAFFFEAAESPARAPTPPPPEPSTAPVEAAVLGAPAAVVPVAAACAGELRARARAAAALICIWRPGETPATALDPESEEPAARSPAGATTPGARRLAARLAAHGFNATACGRLAWLALDPRAGEAAAEFRRCRSIAGAPVVLAVAGPRPEHFEPLLAELDLAVAVLPADIDPALHELALARLPSRSHAIVQPLPPGPPRWAAMAGLARLRSLAEVAP